MRNKRRWIFFSRAFTSNELRWRCNNLREKKKKNPHLRVLCMKRKLPRATSSFLFLVCYCWYCHRTRRQGYGSANSNETSKEHELFFLFFFIVQLVAYVTLRIFFFFCWSVCPLSSVQYVCFCTHTDVNVGIHRQEPFPETKRTCFLFLYMAF